jgi:hyaluronate lyase
MFFSRPLRPILAMALTTLLATTATASDLSQMRDNALAYWRADEASRTSPRMESALATLSANAANALATLQNNGAWPDVTYNANVPDNFVPHYERLQEMARAWATPGTSLHGDAALLDGILAAIDHIETFVNPSTNLNRGNWWWWQNGIPERYGPALLLLREELGAQRLAATAATLDYLVGPTGPRFAAEGMTNQIWWAFGRLFYGLLADHPASVSTAAKRIAQQVRIVGPGEEGLMPDMSFQAHEEQLQTGHYGATFIFRVAEFTQLAANTPYQLDASRHDLLKRFVLEGGRWILFHNYYDISSEGRAFVRAERNAAFILNGILILANTPPSPEQAAAAEAARRLLETWDYPLLPEYAGLAALIDATPGPAALPSGMKAYNLSDYTLFRRDERFISLKTVSTRTLIGETWNNENKRGRHLASGVTWMQTGPEYRRANVLPVLDYHRLPGTTVENGLNLGVAYHYLPGLRPFVGGATTGQHGAVAMDFRARTHNNDSDLVAKKSWFFFEDAMVALGSGITATTSRTVETTVNQRPMAELASPILVDGQPRSTAAGITTHAQATWAHEGDFGYIFPETATVRIRRANQSGRWSDIGSGDSSTIHTHPIFTLWFDHGLQPTAAGYAYAVLPQTDAAHTASKAAAMPYEILARTDALHAVRHVTEQAVGAVFWEVGEVEGVAVDTPCVLFWKTEGTRLHLALTDPTHTTTQVRVTWPAELTPADLPPEVSAEIANGTTRITFDVTNGWNYATTWTLPGATTPVDTPDPAPVASTIEVDGQPHLTLTFRRVKDPAAAGLVYTIETSATLENATWQSDPALFTEHAVDTSPDDHDRVTIRLTAPLAPGEGRFLRVRLSETD